MDQKEFNGIIVKRKEHDENFILFLSNYILDL